MNVAGERAAEGVAGAKATPNPPRSTVTPVSAGGAGIGLCGLTWYAIKLFAARGKPKDWKEMAGGSLVAVCYGTTLGFMGVIVGAATLTGNNVGLWIFGGYSRTAPAAGSRPRAPSPPACRNLSGARS